MLIEQALEKELASSTALTALVGQNIFYVRAPQDVKAPYIIIQKISTLPDHAHDGIANIADSRFQITCFGETYKEVKDINIIIDGVLQNFVGLLSGAGGVYVGRCFKDGEIDLWEDAVGLFNSPLDYLIQHN